MYGLGNNGEEGNISHTQEYQPYSCNIQQGPTASICIWKYLL